MLHSRRLRVRLGSWLLSVVTIALLFATQTTVAQSPTRFSDLQNHWAQSCIEALAQRGVISGFQDGRFRPAEAVTRAQFAAMVVKAFPKQVSTPIRAEAKFRDVPANFWAREAIQTAYRSGFFSGFDDNTFRPNLNIPRAQAFTALANGLKLKPTAAIEPTLALFSDGSDVPAFARNAIVAATEQRMTVNFPDAKQLKPNTTASRAEIAAFLCQAFPETKGLIADRYVPNLAKLTREIRGVWLTNIDSDVLFEQNRLRDAVTELARLNFNTLYPTVWNWGYTLYPSTVMQQDVNLPMDPRPVAAGLQGRDMLKEIITEAHQRNMAVIPWFEFGFMAPKDSELAQKHREWWTQKQDGSVDGSASALDGKQIPIWFNPFKPEVQQFILNLVSEIVTNYNVDGIQFDDHFGLPNEFGYDDYTVQLYKQEHNGKAPPTNVQDPEWLRWRSDKIGQFLEQAFRTVKARKPKAILSFSPLDLPYAYDMFLVDWHKWEKAGLIEELIPQIYFQGQKFVDRIDLATKPELKQARDHIPTAIGILSGLSGNPRAIDELQRQVKAVRDRRYAGMSFFFYETLWNKSPEPTATRKAGWQTLFPSRVDRIALN
jgi:uncharacterized lipoprotein YddW (UPF0748 family)